MIALRESRKNHKFTSFKPYKITGPSHQYYVARHQDTINRRSGRFNDAASRRQPRLWLINHAYNLSIVSLQLLDSRRKSTDIYFMPKRLNFIATRNGMVTISRNLRLLSRWGVVYNILDKTKVRVKGCC